MKKKLLYLTTILLSFNANSQNTVFEDSFETYNDFIISGIGNWQVLDFDLLNTYTGGNATPTWANAGAPMAYQIFNPTVAAVTNGTTGVNGETENRNFDPKTGSKYAACWAGVPSTTGGATANNDWLVSPVINLNGTTGAILSVWVKSMSNSYGLEKYRIGVYVGAGSPTLASDFTYLTTTDQTAPYGIWEEKTFSLSSYEGQSIRIGIQCKTSDAYMFMVDDFKITGVLNNEIFTKDNFTISPNPINNIFLISGINNENIEQVTITDINGRIVKTISTNFQNEINISELNNGLYFVNIKTDIGLSSKKIIKH